MKINGISDQLACSYALASVGLLPASGGAVRFAGEDITRLSPAPASATA